MTVIPRNKLESLLRDIQPDNAPQVFFLFGERYLCQQAADKICDILLKEGGNCHVLDGENEDFSTTLNRLASFSLFPGQQVYRLADTRLFHSVKVAGALWKKAANAHQANESAKAARYIKAMMESAGLDASDPENDPSTITATQWKKLFNFARPQGDISWIPSLLTELPDDTPSPPSSMEDAASLLERTLDTGIPAKNHLLLLAEDVDKRKRLYKYLAEHHIVIDLGVEKGSSSQAQKAQKAVLQDLLRQTLAEFDKNIAPKAAELLFERVGFHPVALVMEAEKLAFYCSSKKLIDVDDLDAVVGRTRQEAVFELTDAIGKRNLEQALLVAGRLADNGIHPLAIIATIKNYSRNLLLFRSLQERKGLGYNSGMQPGTFQKQILPALKEDTRWTKELSGHPYAMFMQFKTAAGFKLSTLQQWMENILRADYRLKGSPIEPQTILQHLIISMLAPQEAHGRLQK